MFTGRVMWLCLPLIAKRSGWVWFIPSKALRRVGVICCGIYDINCKRTLGLHLVLYDDFGKL